MTATLSEIVVWTLDVLLLFAGLVICAAGLLAVGVGLFVGAYYVLVQRSLRGKPFRLCRKIGLTRERSRE